MVCTLPKNGGKKFGRKSNTSYHQEEEDNDSQHVVVGCLGCTLYDARKVFDEDGGKMKDVINDHRKK